MSTLDTNLQAPKIRMKRTIAVYLILSAVAVGVDYIYSLFGHGVRSNFMSWMFLYPLLGGTLVFLLAELLLPKNIAESKGFRLSFNLYNSGIATLTVGSFLKGILDIAGTASPYTMFFFIAGLLLSFGGLIVFAAKPLRNGNNKEYCD